jgi:transposase
LKKEKANKRYTGEFKQQVVEAMHKERLSLKEVVRRFDVSSPAVVRCWDRIYKTEGAHALHVERRGRTKKFSMPILRQNLEDADRSTLVKEIKWLRAENDYLKKLSALVLEEERQSKERKSSQN